MWLFSILPAATWVATRTLWGLTQYVCVSEWWWPYFCASEWCCDWQTLGFLMCAKMLMPAIAHKGCTQTIGESTLKADWGRKIPPHTQDSNRRWTRRSVNWFYIPAPKIHSFCHDSWANFLCSMLLLFAWRIFFTCAAENSRVQPVSHPPLKGLAVETSYKFPRQTEKRSVSQNLDQVSEELVCKTKLAIKILKMRAKCIVSI